MTLSIIVAMAENRVIGRVGSLPWHLPDDLKRFKTLTIGHHLIMGRKTWDSIGRPLPGRTSIVLTRNPAFQVAGVTTAADMHSALAAAGPDSEVFVIGGAEVYAQALPLAQRIFLTLVHESVEGDTVFPPLDPRDWALRNEEHHAADERHAHAFTFQRYECRHKN